MFIVQDQQGDTIAACRGIPEPTDQTWIEVPDDDPRGVVVRPSEPVIDPVQKLKSFLAANPDVAEILK